MADASMAFGSALYTLMATPLGSAFYDSVAPQGGTPPYTVYQIMPSSDEYTMDEGGELLEVQIRTISNRRWPGEGRTTYGTAHSTLQDGALNVTGFDVLLLRRSTKFEYQDDLQFWNIGGVYQIRLWPT